MHNTGQNYNVPLEDFQEVVFSGNGGGGWAFEIFSLSQKVASTLIILLL